MRCVRLCSLARLCLPPLMPRSQVSNSFALAHKLARDARDAEEPLKQPAGKVVTGKKQPAAATSSAQK